MTPALGACLAILRRGARKKLFGRAPASQGERDESLHALHRAGDELTDPEAKYYVARSFARLSAREDALATLSDVVNDGFFCYPAFVTDPWWDGIRHLQPFGELLETAQSRHESAREAFRKAGGDELS